MNVEWKKIIDKKILKDNGVCKKGFKWFNKNYSDATVPIYTIINKLHEDKNSDGFAVWLFETFKLTGRCYDYYSNGDIKNLIFYKNGQIESIRNDDK